VIEALRSFDHLQFRSNMQDASRSGNQQALLLQKPPALSGEKAWFEKFYESGSQAERDRLLFAH
jgi:hypothetical protein